MTQQNTRDPRVSRRVIVLSFVSIAFVFSTMVVGRYLSSTINEQGLVCSGWPLCPNGLGVPEPGYAIEYVHRLLAVISSGLVYATALAVPSSLRKAKRASIIAAAVMSVQIILGYLTVVSDLYPIVVASHLSSGIAIIAFALLAFLWIGIMKKDWN